MSYKIAALGGDGTGPEVMTQGLKVLQALSNTLGFRYAVDSIPCGGRYYLETGQAQDRDWPQDAPTRCEAADLILLGAVGWPHPQAKGPVTMSNGQMAGYSPVIGNRNRLDLYANVRPIKLLPGIKHRISGTFAQVWSPQNVDLVILRENTEGLYAHAAGTLAPGGRAKVAVDTRIITRDASERIVRKAFELCLSRHLDHPNRPPKVTAVVKDNVLQGCQLFRDVFFEIACQYPQVQASTAIVDAFTQWLVHEPERYDVVVTTNMFGDIVTDLGAVLQGGMGMAIGANVGDRHGMFEPVHGSAPDIAGQDKANPLAMVLALSAGLEWLGRRQSDDTLREAATRTQQAVATLAAQGKPLTFDLVGDEHAARCSQVGDALVRLIEQMA